LEGGGGVEGKDNYFLKSCDRKFKPNFLYFIIVPKPVLHFSHSLSSKKQRPMLSLYPEKRWRIQPEQYTKLSAFWTLHRRLE
jgi:hypothetical protein